MHSMPSFDGLRTVAAELLHSRIWHVEVHSAQHNES